MSIEELRAEVDRCQAALNAAKQALFQAEIAPAKYHKDEWVMARRTLPGHSYRDKTLWPAHIVQVYPPRWDGQDISYRIYWRLRDGKFSAKSTSVLERDIEGLEQPLSEDSPPLTKCAICGHIRNDHETVDRQRCGRCPTSKEAAHLFVPEQP